MITCNFCQSADIDDNVDKCPICGCDRKTMETGETAREHREKHFPYPLVIMPAIFIALFAIGFLLPDGGRNPDHTLAIFIAVLAMIALGSITYGIVHYVRHSKKIHQPNMKIVDGKVVALHNAGTGHIGALMVTPILYNIVEFYADGKRLRHVGVKESGKMAKIGAEIEIAYNVDNPYENYVAKDRRGTMVIIASLAGIAFVAIMCYFFLNFYVM